VGTDDKDDRDGGPAELRSLVIAEAKRVSIGMAMRRYGLPYATVRMWLAEEAAGKEEDGGTEEGDSSKTLRASGL
jgi:hypothetical protein